MEGTSMTRAIGYIRLSNFGFDKDSSTSPQRQRDAVTGYCQARGWDLVEIIEDLDVSGSTLGLRMERPGLRQIRSRWHEFDVLVVPKLDRLARDTASFLAIAEEAAAHDVALVSVAESLDLSTPNGRFVASLLAAFSEMESAVIRQRVLEGVERARSLGRWMGGTPPYGYRPVPNPEGGTTLEIVPDEAAIINEMAKRVINGESLASISRDLNRRGVPTLCTSTGRKIGNKRGDGKIEWYTTSIRRILSGPSVVGRCQRKGRVITDAEGRPVQFFEPILTVDTWMAVRSALELNKPAAARRKSGPTPKRLLSRMVRCGLCTGPMYPVPNNGVREYRCSRANRREGCPGTTAKCEFLEQYLVDQLMERYGDRNVMKIINESPTEPADLVEVREAIEFTLQRMNEDDADLAELGQKLSALKQVRKQLESAPRQAKRTLVDTGKTFRELYDAAITVEEKQDILRSKIEWVELYRAPRPGRRIFDPERVIIRWAEEEEELPRRGRDELDEEFPATEATVAAA